MPSTVENFPRKNDRTFHQRCLSRARDEPAETPLAPAIMYPAYGTHNRLRSISGNGTNTPIMLSFKSHFIHVAHNWFLILIKLLDIQSTRAHCGRNKMVIGLHTAYANIFCERHFVICTCRRLVKTV